MEGSNSTSPYFAGISLDWVIDNRAESSLIAFVTCSLATLISAWAIINHLRHYGKPGLQRYHVRILGLIPIYSLTSFICLQLSGNSSSAIYIESLRDCYEAFVVYSFLSLVLALAGGESTCVIKMKDEPVLHHLFPFGYILPPTPRNGRLLRICKKSTLQFVFIKPVFAFISLVMLITGNYNDTAYQILLAIVYNVSYSVALYALVMFYLATKHALIGAKAVRKFVAVKIIIFLTFWQSSFINIIPGISENASSSWQNLILCLELPFFAFFLACAFSPREFQGTIERQDESEVLKNIKEVMSVTDIVADAYHNFMPSYQDYMLQRMTEDESNSSSISSPAAGDVGGDDEEQQQQSSGATSTKASEIEEDGEEVDVL